MSSQELVPRMLQFRPIHGKENRSGELLRVEPERFIRTITVNSQWSGEGPSHGFSQSMGRHLKINSKKWKRSCQSMSHGYGRC